jgi:23S rRNA pseudouridine1911/1915/1917 synthase
MTVFRHFLGPLRSPGYHRAMSPHVPRDLSVPDEELILVVRDDEDGRRLDRFLADRMPWRSRTSIRRLLDENRVDAGSRALRPGTRLRAGDRLRIELPPPDTPVKSAEIVLDVLLEDDVLVAINKQPGIVVHPVGIHRYDTLINALHHRYRRMDDPGADVVPKLAHRIDQFTSGVLLVAKRDDIRMELGRQFEEREVHKEYLAIVDGRPPEDSGTMVQPLGPDPSSANKTLQAARDDGLPSRTDYAVEESFREHAFVRCMPHTGRTHQIRVHLAANGCPILCDHLYGDPEPFRDPRSGQVLLDRFALHAARLDFTHPVSGGRVTVRAPLPADMEATLGALRRMER